MKGSVCVKKVGILSMQRIKNYGSFLQAFGLKTTIESLGHTVEFVDYNVEPCIVGRQNIKKKSMCRRVLGKVKRTVLGKNRGNEVDQKSLATSYHEYLKMLNIIPEYKYRSNLDTLVIGSDEVFNCLQSNPDVGYSKELFGYRNNAKRLISYAASYGTTTVEGLKKYGIANEVGYMLSKFDAISVRDNNSGNVVKELANREPIYNLDPVLISNFDKYIPNSVDLKNYIIVYAYANRITEEEQNIIIKFARKNNKKLVTVGVPQPFCDIYLKADPFQLLAYVKNADYIITDTFHGTVFSIKYNIPFGTIIRHGNKQKLSDLLQRFELMERCISDINDLEKIITKPINFDYANQFIKDQTEYSLKYLKDNI